MELIPLTSDPNSWINAALSELRFTLESKNDDYRIDGEFSNFEFASQVTGLTPQDVIGSQLAIKIGRLKGLNRSTTVNHEALIDTYKDLAGYAVILYAYVLAHTTETADLPEGDGYDL